MICFTYMNDKEFHAHLVSPFQFHEIMEIKLKLVDTEIHYSKVRCTLQIIIHL